MRLHRFIGSFDLSSRNLIVEDAELAGQLSKVLRLKEGDEVILCDGKEWESVAEIRSIRATSVSFRIGMKEQVSAESTRGVTLFCSILKRENFEFVVQKATELGVATIVPTVCVRTIKQELKAERLCKIAKEAAEQSGRGSVPTIASPIPFSEAVKQGSAHDEQFFFHPSGKPFGGISHAAQRIAAFVGPEGGWAESEIAEAKQAGMTIVSLGSLTLRAETAAIIAVYCAFSERSFSER